MSFKIAGKVALVTGAASGLGYAYVKAFLEHKAKAVAIVDVDSQKGMQALEELTKTFGHNKCIFVKCDVSISKSFEAAFEETVATFKQLDIVVNNAGIYNEANWEKAMSVNVNGCINGTLLALEKYLPKNKNDKEGVIINIASVYGLHHTPLAPVYVATKAAVLAFSRAYGDEEHYNRTNVKIIALCPGFTSTPMMNVSPEQNCEWHQQALEKQRKINPERKLQTPDHVAENLMKIIEEARSKSVWVVTKGAPAFEETFVEKSDYV